MLLHYNIIYICNTFFSSCGNGCHGNRMHISLVLFHSTTCSLVFRRWGGPCNLVRVVKVASECDDLQ